MKLLDHISAGGDGSGCHGDNCGRPKTSKIEEHLSMWNKFNHNFTKPLLQTEVLKYGKYQEETSFTKEEKSYIDKVIKKGGGPDAFRIKSCYANSQWMIKHDKDGKLQYNEGYFISDKLPLEIHHAWVTLNGKVFDPTQIPLSKWRSASNYHKADNEKREYWGVEIPRDIVKDSIKKHGGNYSPITGQQAGLSKVLKKDK